MNDTKTSKTIDEKIDEHMKNEGWNEDQYEIIKQGSLAFLYIDLGRTGTNIRVVSKFDVYEIETRGVLTGDYDLRIAIRRIR